MCVFMVLTVKQGKATSAHSANAAPFQEPWNTEAATGWLLSASALWRLC